MTVSLLFFLFALWQAELLPSGGLPRWRRRTAARRFGRWLAAPSRERGVHPLVPSTVRFAALFLVVSGLGLWWWSVLSYFFGSNLHP